VSKRSIHLERKTFPNQSKNVLVIVVLFRGRRRGELPGSGSSKLFSDLGNGR